MSDNSKAKPQSPRRYTPVAMFLHWTTVILVFTNWGLAEFAGDIASPPTAKWLSIMGWHFTFGFTVLLLTVFRAYWRHTHMPPNWVWDITKWEINIVKITEPLIYALLILAPLMGWIAISALDIGINFYGIHLPPLPIHLAARPSMDLVHIHAFLADTLLLVVLLHICGALKHQFIDKDREIERMVPFGKAPNTVDDGPPASAKSPASSK